MAERFSAPAISGMLISPVCVSRWKNCRGRAKVFVLDVLDCFHAARTPPGTGVFANYVADGAAFQPFHHTLIS